MSESDKRRERAASHCVTHHICDCKDWQLTQAERRAERAEGLLIQSRDAVQDRYPALVARINAYFADKEPRT